MDRRAGLRRRDVHPRDGLHGAPTPVEYTAADGYGQSVRSTVTVTYLPQAAADRSAGNALGQPVVVDVTGNDSTTLDPTTVRLLDAAGKPVTTLAVAGEGTWTVDPATGKVTFTPLAGYTGNPTAVRYTVADRAGHTTESTITVVYAPMAVDDASLDHHEGETVTVDVTANDSRNVDPGTVRLLDADRHPVQSLVVAGQGTWTVDPATGRIPFTPAADATRNPTPVEYSVWDASGDEVSATVTVAYRGAAAALPAPAPSDPRPAATPARRRRPPDSPSPVRNCSGRASRHSCWPRRVVCSCSRAVADAAAGTPDVTP